MMFPALKAPAFFPDPFAGWPAAAQSILGFPFDALRAQYASAVQAGLLERSLIAAGEFEGKLSTLERMTLGPWARSV